MVGMKNPSIISGLTVVDNIEYPYTGLGIGKTEFRIYEDRDGWFVEGVFVGKMPSSHQAKSIWRAVQRAKPESFLEYMQGKLEKWQLKERAEI